MLGILVYEADEMSRSELLSRLKLKINMDMKEGHPIPLNYDDKRPWEAVIKPVPNKLKFWEDQIHKI